MNCGTILHALGDGTWVLRFRGDVRAPWCATLDGLVEQVFTDKALKAVVVDLREAANIDSTMLGMLARIAVRSRQQLGHDALLVGPNPDVRRLLDSMCFEKICRIVDSAAEAACQCAELSPEERPESEFCRQVADAHRVLMDIDERNRAAFRDVVATLEDQQRTAGGR